MRISFIFTALILLVSCNGSPQLTSESSSSAFPNTYSMYGPSMEPAIYEGDILVIDPTAPLERGSIVVFTNPIDSSQQLVKRIVGLPNETVKIENGEIRIADNKFDEPYLSEQFKDKTSTFGSLHTFLIPENGYFVLGDNRTRSSDSRNCFQALQKQDECIVGEIPFYITKGEIHGVVIRHVPEEPPEA